MYSTVEDLAKIIPERTIAQLTDDAGAAVDQAVVDEAIEASDEVIDAYLGGRYDLPFAPVPPIVSRLSADITIFHLYGRRPEREMPKTIEMKYRESVRMLEKIRDGVMNIVYEGGSEPPESGSYRTNRKSEERVFRP